MTPGLVRAAIVAVLAAAAPPAGHSAPPKDEQARPLITGRRGMVLTLNPLSSVAGLRILMKGGNAFDAAVAAAVATTVVDPKNSSIGGQGFATVYVARNREVLQALSRRLTPYPSSRRVYFQDGRAPRPGEVFRQPDLTATLKAIARNGADAFYRGPIARSIAEFYAAHGGLLSYEDLASYEASWVEPISTTYRGYAVYKWEHLNLEEKSAEGKPAPVWIIPPENRKGRAGKKRGLIVPLSPQARRTFEDVKRTTREGDWIFSAGPRANLSANFGRLGAALKKATGVAFGFHDLRATCATGAGRLGAPPHVIALLLGHQGVPGTPTSRLVTIGLTACPRFGRHSTDGASTLKS